MHLQLFFIDNFTPIKHINNQEMFAFPPTAQMDYGRSPRDNRDAYTHSSSIRMSQQRSADTSGRDTSGRDRDINLRSELQSKRETKSKEVWKRIERPHEKQDSHYRERERYHPYAEAPIEPYWSRHGQEKYNRTESERLSERSTRDTIKIIICECEIILIEGRRRHSHRILNVLSRIILHLTRKESTTHPRPGSQSILC